MASRSGLYIRTPRRCIIAEGNLLSPERKQVDDDMVGLAALIDGVVKNGRRVPPAIRLEGLINDHAKVYTIGQEPQIELLSIHSLRCLVELNRIKATPEDLRRSPDRIEIHLHQSNELPNVPEEWMKGVRTFAHGLVDRQEKRRYCRVAFGTRDRFIERVRIDVLGLAQELPRIADYHAMDCIMRGVIASYGYTGILSYDLREIYPQSQLNKSQISSGRYASTLMDAFSQYTGRLADRLSR